MPIGLLLVDLDDTLLGGDLEISPANRTALAAAAARGVRVTLASGRMFQSMRPYAEALGIAHPLIAYNGALARPLAGSDLWHEPLEAATARALIRRLEVSDVTVNLYHDDRLFVRELDARILAYTANARVQAEPVGDLLAFLGGARPTKILAIGQPDTLAELHAALDAQFAGHMEAVISKPHYLEITAPGISKAMALARLAAVFGLSLAETMAIGDAPNDLGMLLAAGVGVAVGSAPPEVLARAPHVTTPSDRDGVAVAIERFVLANTR